MLVACHPTKSAADDNLMPRGGGAFLNEIDGNTTAHGVGGGTELRRHPEKFRGPYFAPVSFRLRSVTHERLKDSKGRLIPTVIAEPLSEQAKEDIAKAVLSHEDEVLVLLLDENVVNLNSRSIARRLGWVQGARREPNHSRVQRILEKLDKAKLIIMRNGTSPRLTKKGREEAELAKAKREKSNPTASQEEENEE